MDWTSVGSVVVIVGAQVVTEGDAISNISLKETKFGINMEITSPSVTSRCQSNFWEVLNDKA